MMLSCTQAAEFETTRRLLACLINEGLVQTRIVSKSESEPVTWLQLQNLKETQPQPAGPRVCVATSSDAKLSWTEKPQGLFLQPDDLVPPVIIEYGNAGGDVEGSEGSKKVVEFRPAKLFDLIATWFLDPELIDSAVREQIGEELNSSARNQEEWLRITLEGPPPELADPAIKWERAIIRGHPTHPMHRSCLALPPLDPIDSTDLLSVINPSIAFLSVLYSDVVLVGPFIDALKPLLEQLHVPQPEQGRLSIPCLARQIPVILQTFPNVHVLPTKPQGALAQASLRTVQLPPEAKFPYILKFALCCRVTSAIRTVTPWTACVGPEMSELLTKLLPAALWVCTEIAAVTGSQQDFEEAKVITCLLREDLESRARAKRQALIVAAALAESGADNDTANAERVFGLDTGEKRRRWFRSYTFALLHLILQPLLKYGIALEAHGQNMLLRVDIQTHEIAGFAVRDIGGIKIHMPTLRQQGYELRSALPGNVIETDDRTKVWGRTHHALFQVHLNQLIRALRLQHDGGWGIVREELRRFVDVEMENGAVAKEMEEFFLEKTMPMKCFLSMRMEGIYRTYIYRDVPNILLG